MPQLALPPRDTPIYLDYAATTPIAEPVWDAMSRCAAIDQCFGNPASSHSMGQDAKLRVEHARQQVANLLNTDAKAITWTSGATEANNLALKGATQFYGIQHIASSRIEHKSVVDTCEYLSTQGIGVSWLDHDAQGRIGLLQVQHAVEAAAAQAQPIGLISVMWVNNETGTINDIPAIAAYCQQQAIRLHVDATQAVGKLAIDLSCLPIDYLSLSAHKLYGPKGIGALYTRQKPRARLQAQIHGGGHERGLRSGTLATQQIVGLGAACELAQQEMDSLSQTFNELRSQLWQGLNGITGISCNSQADTTHQAPNILNISVAGVNGEALLYALQDIAVSSGSACTSATQEPSYVLRALGLDDALAEASLRFSFGRYTTAQDIDDVLVLCRLSIPYLQTVSGWVEHG